MATYQGESGGTVWSTVGGTWYAGIVNSGSGSGTNFSHMEDIRAAFGLTAPAGMS